MEIDCLPGFMNVTQKFKLNTPLFYGALFVAGYSDKTVPERHTSNIHRCKANTPTTLSDTCSEMK